MAERSQFGLEVKTDVAVIANPAFSHFDGHLSGIEEAMATIALRTGHQGENMINDLGLGRSMRGARPKVGGTAFSAVLHETTSALLCVTK